MSFPSTYAQGAAVIIADTGQTVTNPDLHRTIASSDMTDGKVFRLRVQGLNSYRIEQYSMHDEESDDSEIP